MLDDAKHYWVSPDEVDKLVRAGGGWLATHPEKELITRRYLAHRGVLTRDALARLAEVDDTEPELIDNAADAPLVGEEPDRPVPLAQQRRGAVLAAVRASGARRVGDLGCGEGALVADLLADRSIERVVAVDVSARTLELAARKLRLDRMTEQQRARLEIFQSSLTYRDDRLAGLDAAVLMEVIEHVDPPRLGALERAVFGHAAPGHGDRDDAQRRVQRAVRDACRRGEAAPRPPLRVDPRRVPRLGRPGRGRTRLRRAVPAGRDGRPRGRARRPRWPSSPRTRRAGGRRMSRELSVPELSLVVLIGVSGSGKSTFGRTHFRPTEVISSDFCRGIVADDENDQSATPQAFELLNYIVGLRLAAGRLTVVDATNVQPDARKKLVALAREHDVLPVAIVLDLPERLCLRTQRRPAGPRLRRARHPPPARPAAPRAAGPAARGVPHRPRAERTGRGRRRRHHPHPALQRPAARDRPVRRHRRHPRLPRRARSTAHRARLHASPATSRAARSVPIRTAAARCSSATSSTAARTPRACCGW